jgi:dienelactone hydrolase
LAIVLLSIATGTSCAAAPANDSTNVQTVMVRGQPIQVFTYRPSGCKNPSLLFVFHGALRNGEAARNAAERIASRACLIVYAPLLDKRRFPTEAYQQGGIAHRGRVLPPAQWTVWFATDLVSWARQREHRPNAPYYLFGHSAGGQYLSRVAAFALPRDARRIVVANPSTYVLPSLKEDAPYGLDQVASDSAERQRLRDYLAQPITIFLGGDDTGERELGTSDQAMRQGSNRLSRGVAVFRMAKRVAAENNWPFGWSLVVAPSVGHSSSNMLDAPEAAEAFGLAMRPGPDRTNPPPRNAGRGVEQSPPRYL